MSHSNPISSKVESLKEFAFLTCEIQQMQHDVMQTGEKMGRLDSLTVVGYVTVSCKAERLTE